MESVKIKREEETAPLKSSEPEPSAVFADDEM